jgi:chromosome segregation ATPase
MTSLEQALNEYKFINLTKDSVYDLITELTKEKSNSIKKFYFLEIMEQMSKEYQYKLETIAQKKVNFVDEDLDKPELNNFIYLLTFIKILLKISDSVLLCHEKNIKDIKNNEILNAEYLNRNLFVLVNNMKLYFYEIMRIYYEQKQKFDYYSCVNISKITILKQENKDLAEQLKAKEFEDNNEKIINNLYEEIKNEKNKFDDLLKENQKLKKEIINNNDKIDEYDNKIKEMNKIQEENEGKINKLNKENELQKEKYKNIFNQLNSLVISKKENEQRLNESIEKMNLSQHLLYLVNMDKADIISLFNEKDKYFTSIENNNKELQKKIKELEKDVLQKNEEIKDVKYNNNMLIKKNEMLQNEIDNSKKEMQEQAEKSFLLSSVIDDKIDREDYENLENQLNEEKEKNLKMKKNIDELNEEISKKEEDIIRSKNKINSQDNIIKDNESKINNLNEQIKQNNDKFNELMEKYKNLISKIEEDERKLNNAIENLNLSEKYQPLINKEKPDLIKLIIERDDYISKIENENSLNKGEINDLKSINQQLNEEINKNKAMINDLNKKIFSLENDLNASNTEKNQLQKNLLNKEEELNKEKTEKEKIEKNLSDEKKKNELLLNDNKNMKNEIITQKENISKAKNEISLLQNKNNEKDEQINSLTKEKDILNKNYKDLLNKYNQQLTNTKEKEKRASIAIQNLNLTGENLKLANMSKDQLISLIIEKDKYLKMTEDLNKDLNEKIEKITKEKNLIEEECNTLKLNIVDLEKKISLLEQDNEHIKKDK